MNRFEWFRFNLPETGIMAYREHYSRQHNSLTSALHEIRETIVFFIHPEDRAMADWGPEIWLPKIMDHCTPELWQDQHFIGRSWKSVSDNDQTT
jgi:hypothetical protein